VVAERIDLQSAKDVETAFETAVARHVDALIDEASPLLSSVRDRLASWRSITALRSSCWVEPT
jgi:hypothetical protein